MPRRMSDVSYGDVVLPARLVSELQELPGFLQSACYDMADPMCVPEMWKEAKGQLTPARLGRPTRMEDIKEAVADRLYNEAGVMCDVLGDRIHDAFSTAGCYGDRDRLWNFAVMHIADQISHLRAGILEKLTRPGPGPCPRCSNPMEYGDEDQEERVCDTCAGVSQCA